MMKILVACEESQAGTIEQWKDVGGFDDYEVSNYGRVRSKPRTVTYSDGRTRAYKPVVLKPGTSAGYGFVNLMKGKKHHSSKIHWLVAKAFIGGAPRGCEVCHNDGNRRNNRADNLRYDTRRNNNLDKYNSCGYITVNQKIYPSDVPHVLALHASGHSYQQIANMYGTAKTTIGAICRRESFDWVEVSNDAEQ